MAKAARFPRKLEVWVPDQLADGLEALAADGMLTISDHARQALLMYLRQYGIAAVAPRPKPNGQHHEEKIRGVHV